METLYRNFPAPIDDGACRHLPGLTLPNLALRSTSGLDVNLAEQAGTVVLYCFPAIATSGAQAPPGWDAIPGARGCNTQSCTFRDHHAELLSLGVSVFGLSTQTPETQRAAVQQLSLQFELLSDESHRWSKALGLPYFEFEGVGYLRRVTLVTVAGRVARAFYPIFPPDHHIYEVLDWLRSGR